jgi:hypothetical protein
MAATEERTYLGVRRGRRIGGKRKRDMIKHTCELCMGMNEV